MDVLDIGSARLSFFPKMMTAPKEYEETVPNFQVSYFAAQGRGF